MARPRRNDTLERVIPNPECFRVRDLTSGDDGANYLVQATSLGEVPRSLATSG